MGETAVDRVQRTAEEIAHYGDTEGVFALADIAATLAALDAATARVQALEAQVRKDHAECGCEDEPAARHCTRCGHWAPCCDMSVGQCPVHGEEQRAPVDESPCAVLTALALAPPPGEENG